MTSLYPDIPCLSTLVTLVRECNVPQTLQGKICWLEITAGFLSRSCSSGPAGALSDFRKPWQDAEVMNYAPYNCSSSPLTCFRPLSKYLGYLGIIRRRCRHRLAQARCDQQLIFQHMYELPTWKLWHFWALMRLAGGVPGRLITATT